MYLFFDTETTGLPKRWGRPATEVNNFPRIIQLAFILFDENGNEMESYCELIKPDGWEIPKEKFWIDNGYSTEQNLKEGVDIRQALIKFIELLGKSKFKVAHNISFDNPIVGAELIRLGANKSYNIFANKKGYCTMRNTTNLVGIKKGHAGGNKWPKLEELYEYLFGYKFDNAHDALADVQATARCFFELKKRGLIKNF